MELFELANAQFAVPVVGVFLCALLVFAFGFKSPVPPPSYIISDSDVIHRQTQIAKKKRSRRQTKVNVI